MNYKKRPNLVIETDFDQSQYEIRQPNYLFQSYNIQLDNIQTDKQEDMQRLINIQKQLIYKQINQSKLINHGFIDSNYTQNNKLQDSNYNNISQNQQQTIEGNVCGDVTFNCDQSEIKMKLNRIVSPKPKILEKIQNIDKVANMEIMIHRINQLSNYGENKQCSKSKNNKKNNQISLVQLKKQIQDVKRTIDKLKSSSNQIYQKSVVKDQKYQTHAKNRPLRNHNYTSYRAPQYKKLIDTKRTNYLQSQYSCNSHLSRESRSRKKSEYKYLQYQTNTKKLAYKLYTDR